MTFPHTATIQKQTKVGTKYTYGDSSTTKCFLQPLDSESSIAYGITFSKGSVCYLPSNTTVVESDKLVINSRTYGVKGIRVHEYGFIKHAKAVLEAL